MDESILGSLGMFVQFLFTPLGFGSQLTSAGWVFAVSAVTGLIAKENVIATFGTLAGCLSGALIQSEDGVMQVQAMISATGITIPALIAFIVFNMTTIPCFASVASAKGEMSKKTFKWTLAFWIATSYISASIIYTVGAFPWTVVIWLTLAVVAIVSITLFNRYRAKKEGNK